MKIGLIGVGRMGKALTARLADHFDLTIFDRDTSLLTAVAEEYGLQVGTSIEDMSNLGTVIMAVPDREVISCIKTFNQIQQPLKLINIATNVDRNILREMPAKHVQCISAKIISQADEMMLGQRPVIVIDERPPELVPLAQEIFAGVGEVIVGKADLVSMINTIAAERILTAAVNIEESLLQQNIADPAIIKAAIRQVAVGILKAYADSNLGPFAREIVQVVRSKMRK